MKLSEFFFSAHRLIEVKEKKKITQPEMAKKLGASHRTYVEYLRGTNEPLAATVVMEALTSVEWDEAKKLLEQWEAGKGQKEGV